MNRLPAEWEPQEAILLTWPHNPTDWPGKLREVRNTYIELIRHITPHQPVWLLTQNSQQPAKASIPDHNLRIVDIETNRSWIRDYGPISVFDQKGQRILLDFTFNGWARFPAHQKDNAATSQLASLLKSPVQPVTWKNQPVVLEGGSIDTNGQGTLLTTRECLLSDTRQKRNPHLSQRDLEEMFTYYFGTDHIIWLGKGIEGDDTHGHVDDITRFVSPDTLITMVENNRSDPNHQALADNLTLLKKESHLTIVDIPMPRKIMYRDFRLPVSYANFLITNHTVLVPVFDDPNDDPALNILTDLFPTRTVTGIPATDILTGLGGIHCISMQVPSFV